MSTSTDGRSENRYNIRVLDRAFGVLALLSDGKPRSLQQLSQEMHLSPSTAFRQLASLAQYRYVERNGATGQYRLGVACLELARAYSEADDLRRIAVPELETLRDETRETVHLAVLDQMEIIYIEKLQGLHAIGLMGSRVGGRAPAFCTGVGKVLLAYQSAGIVKRYFQRRKLQRYTAQTITTVKALTAELEAIRSRGYAIDHGEHEAQVCCVAAPIFGLRGEVIAGLSISGPAERMEPIERNRKMIENALLTAGRISASLGYSCP
ncbi:MAG: IclR family transcriptional regulator [Anaerolineae bacterium]